MTELQKSHQALQTSLEQSEDAKSTLTRSLQDTERQYQSLQDRKEEIEEKLERIRQDFSEAVREKTLAKQNLVDAEEALRVERNTTQDHLLNIKSLEKKSSLLEEEKSHLESTTFVISHYNLRVSSTYQKKESASLRRQERA